MIAGVAAVGEPYVWTPSDLFGLLQFIVAVLGLGFAGWQLLRTANATEASQSLLARRLLTNDLLVLLPEVHRLEDAVEKAARAGDREQTSDALRAYVQRVPTVIGHLKSDELLSDEKVVRLLSQAVSAARNAKGSLYESADKPIDLVRAAHKKMMTASIEISEVTARLQKGAEVGK